MSTDQTPVLRASWGSFVGAVIFGMGFHVGWCLISLVVWVLARSVGQDVPILK